MFTLKMCKKLKKIFFTLKIFLCFISALTAVRFNDYLRTCLLTYGRRNIVAHKNSCAVQKCVECVVKARPRIDHRSRNLGKEKLTIFLQNAFESNRKLSSV